ncbi:phospholipase D-like domain-containing protein [Pacificibacter maritimus]|nr:phospholipase D-like domain-containing protein [Pacificibacter maritimus]
MSRKDNAGQFFVSGKNCWRVAQAEQLSFVVDGEDYFIHLRRVMATAKSELLLVGWDFDFEIEMLPGESDAKGNAPDGLPNKLGAYLEAVVENAPELQVYILKWNGAVVVAPGRILPAMALDIFGSDRIHLALDSHHPLGACHHQKIVVADNSFAFCGGIDATESRWDTSAHRPDDPRRVKKNGAPAEPWHDVTCAVTGPAAEALAELSRRRWKRATGEEFDGGATRKAASWPKGLAVDATNVDVAIARTEPPYNGSDLINEVEQLFLDSIATAKETIYFESQYFTAESVFDALEKSLQQPSGPEIVVINPQAALSQMEDDAMHVLRGRFIDRLKAADHANRFRIYHPVNSAEDPIYVHAKVNIIDTRILHVGSSNIDDRSLGFDTECDVAIEGAHDAISAFRTRLLSEHLDVEQARFDEVFAQTQSLICAIETLNSAKGRGLRDIHVLPERLRGTVLADARLMDQRYHPEQDRPKGEGGKPRHIFAFAGLVALAHLGRILWRRWTGR